MSSLGSDQLHSDEGMLVEHSCDGKADVIVVSQQFHNGDSYEGQSKGGRMHGRGIYRRLDGGIYDGQWLNGKKEGHGVYIWPDGAKRYDGEWREGRMHGHGTLFRGDEMLYCGDWENGMKHGEGTLYGSNFAKYVGQFREGLKSGHGKEKTAQGVIRQGEFYLGRMNGLGAIKFPNGRFYKGEFANDMPEGRGKELTPQGFTVSGEYKAGLPDGDIQVDQQCKSEGVCGQPLSKDNLLYSGHAERGKWHGDGTWHAILSADLLKPLGSLGTAHILPFLAWHGHEKNVQFYGRYEGTFSDGLASGWGNLEILACFCADRVESTSSLHPVEDRTSNSSTITCIPAECLTDVHQSSQCTTSIGFCKDTDPHQSRRMIQLATYRGSYLKGLPHGPGSYRVHLSTPKAATSGAGSQSIEVTEAQFQQGVLQGVATLHTTAHSRLLQASISKSWSALMDACGCSLECISGDISSLNQHCCQANFEGTFRQGIANGPGTIRCILTSDVGVSHSLNSSSAALSLGPASNVVLSVSGLWKSGALSLASKMDVSLSIPSFGKAAFACTNLPHQPGNVLAAKFLSPMLRVNGTMKGGQWTGKVKALWSETSLDSPQVDAKPATLLDGEWDKFPFKEGNNDNPIMIGNLNDSAKETSKVSGFLHFSGVGLLKVVDFLEYNGQFQSGLPHGRGILSLQDGPRLDGNFKFGIPCGICLIYFSNGGKARVSVSRDCQPSGPCEYMLCCGTHLRGSLSDSGLFQGVSELSHPTLSAPIKLKWRNGHVTQVMASNRWVTCTFPEDCADQLDGQQHAGAAHVAGVIPTIQRSKVDGVYLEIGGKSVELPPSLANKIQQLGKLRPLDWWNENIRQRLRLPPFPTVPPCVAAASSAVREAAKSTLLFKQDIYQPYSHV